MRTHSLPKPAIAFLAVLGLLGHFACGRKGDPIPRPRATAQPCGVLWRERRVLEVTLPLRDSNGIDLVGIEALRVYHLPMGVSRPTPAEVLTKGEIVLEQRRPDLPPPGKQMLLDLNRLSRKPGWLVVVAVRVGNVVGQPSETLAWLHPAI